MLVSKSNGFNASAVLGSGSYNENKSSKHMELLAHSILKLICKEAASETYRGALETLQKMMSECIYQEGNAFVIMGAGEQLKRIKYEVGENNLKVFNVHFNNNHELVREGANKRGNSSRLTQSFHFFMFEPIFSPVNALNQPI